MKLSVITINYNRKADLEATIASVAIQSFKDFEYIVIDGGSSDGSLEGIQRYKSAVNQWVSEEDKGIFDAIVRIRQKSLKARGYKLLAVLGSFVLNIYFSLGGKPFKFLETLKPACKNYD